MTNDRNHESQTIAMTIIWELDFYSRPIIDENQKKCWEVVICESPLNQQHSGESLFRFAKFCSGNEVNSIWLQEAIAEAIAKAPAPPSRIRFFRRQMNNMIVKACKDSGIDPLPSRRTIALNQWLQQRAAEVYPNQPGYDAAAAAASIASVRYQPQTPSPLPDALQGQRWTFATLQAGAFDEMAEWDIAFGESFPLQLLDLAPETPIPGVIIYSPRAIPLAGWMSGTELAFIKASFDAPPRLILETGANESWVVASLAKPQMQAEAQEFEQTKQSAKLVHFLAVQSDPQSESFAGFWLLQEVILA